MCSFSATNIAANYLYPCNHVFLKFFFLYLPSKGSVYLSFNLKLGHLLDLVRGASKKAERGLKGACLPQSLPSLAAGDLFL